MNEVTKLEQEREKNRVFALAVQEALESFNPDETYTGQDVQEIFVPRVSQLAKRMGIQHDFGKRAELLRNTSRRVRYQRQQIRLLAEKLEAMKTWRGIFRTIGQKLGISR